MQNRFATCWWLQKLIKFAVSCYESDISHHKKSLKMFYSNICLFLSTIIALSSCITRLENCKTATTECCDLATEDLWNQKLDNVKVDVACPVYWEKNKELFSKFYFKNYKCGTWTCDCPNFEQKFRDISRVLLKREADMRFQHCKPKSSGSGTPYLRLMGFAAVLVSYSLCS